MLANGKRHTFFSCFFLMLLLRVGGSNQPGRQWIGFIRRTAWDVVVCHSTSRADGIFLGKDVESWKKRFFFRKKVPFQRGTWRWYSLLEKKEMKTLKIRWVFLQFFSIFVKHLLWVFCCHTPPGRWGQMFGMKMVPSLGAGYAFGPSSVAVGVGLGLVSRSPINKGGWREPQINTH